MSIYYIELQILIYTARIYKYINFYYNFFYSFSIFQLRIFSFFAFFLPFATNYLSYFVVLSILHRFIYFLNLEIKKFPLLFFSCSNMIGRDLLREY